MTATVVPLPVSPKETQAALARVPLMVQLGTGTCRFPGWVNCDLVKTKYSDVAFDCQNRWPFPDSSVGTVYASHMLEHLDRPFDFFREMHRCLIPNGSVTLRMPYGAHRSAWIDLTHIRPWFAECFCALQPGYAESVGNPQHKEWKTFYGIDRCQLRLDPRLRPLVRYPLIRPFALRWISRIVDSVEELWVYLFALKGQEAITQYQSTRLANTCPAEYTMYEHQYYRTPYDESQGLKVISFNDEGIVSCDYGKRSGQL